MKVFLRAVAAFGQHRSKSLTRLKLHSFDYGSSFLSLACCVAVCPAIVAAPGSTPICAL